ncbi:hypothetical protein IFR05_003941 [Cadophora sp. M221]|nr:hypothetical protein IFR05_003941 [Cadophora sp. M221]
MPGILRRLWSRLVTVVLSSASLFTAEWTQNKFLNMIQPYIPGFSIRKLRQYHYTSLDEQSGEIRLMILLPGPFDAPIHVLLQTTQFTRDNVPEYEALSYTWGSADYPKMIRVGDAPLDRTALEITGNLAQALPYLRHASERRTLWIDAICVNQQNLQERSSQVKRMPDLYSKAKGVVVWLGPNEPDSAVAMNLLQEMGSKVLVNWNAYTYTDVSDPEQTGGRAGDSQVPTDVEDRLTFIAAEISAIGRILNRQWFERLWIVQEICLAPQATMVQCGHAIAPWDHFSNGIYLLHTKRWAWYDPLEEQVIRARLTAVVTFLRLKYRSYASFRGLLEDTKKQKCSDPRDRIFAILSLAKDLDLEPDYTKSATETFKDVMLSYLKSMKSLDTVISSGCNLQDHEGPSWVPDWSNLPPVNPIVQHLASGESEAVFRCEGDTLIVQGIAVGYVKHAEPFALSGVARTAYFIMATEIRRVISCILDPSNTNPVPSQDLIGIAQTLIPNTLANNYFPEDSNDPNLEETRDYLASLLEAQHSPETIDTEHSGRAKRILDHIQFFCCDRAFYSTEDGHFGLGPKTIQSGDQIAILLGSNLPAALRPVGQCKWQVVGETYLNGFSNGEGLLGPLPDGVRVVSRLDNDMESWAYLNEETGVLDIEDPRLGSLQSPWSRKKHPEDSRWTWYLNTETGEEREKEIGDPRLDYDQLLKRQISIQEFILI